MQEFIDQQLEWLNKNGSLISSCQFVYDGFVIDFHKRSDGTWYYDAPW